MQSKRASPMLWLGTVLSLLVGWWAAPLLWGIVWVVWTDTELFAHPIYGWQVAGLAVVGLGWLVAHVWLASKWNRPWRWLILAPPLVFTAIGLLPSPAADDGVSVELIEPASNAPTETPS